MLKNAEGTVATIQANQTIGTAHSLATVSRVHDTWGNSVVRKDHWVGWFPQVPPLHSSKLAASQQQQRLQLSASKKKVGSRQQTKASAAQADQEIIPAAASVMPTAAPTATAGPSSRPPKAFRLWRCRECDTCKRPRLTKCCLRSKQQNAVNTSPRPRCFSTCWSHPGTVTRNSYNSEWMI